MAESGSSWPHPRVDMPAHLFPCNSNESPCFWKINRPDKALFPRQVNNTRRMVFFDEVYRSSPPWDIGRAQREFVALEESEEIVGDVLDVGCGTGDNALFLAGRGHTTWGIDLAPRAITIARERAQKKGATVKFLVRNALRLHELDRNFGTVIDFGLFHVLSDAERSDFIGSLARCLGPGGRYVMLAFSNLEPGEFNLPRRIAPQEVRASFSSGWRIDWIRPAVFESRIRPNGSQAWISSITRI